MLTSQVVQEIMLNKSNTHKQYFQIFIPIYLQKETDFNISAILLNLGTILVVNIISHFLSIVVKNIFSLSKTGLSKILQLGDKMLE